LGAASGLSQKAFIVALDSSDFQLMKNIRQAIREGDEATHNLLRKIAAQEEMSVQTQKEMLKAFNRLADKMEALTDAVEGLRTDMASPLDKVKKSLPMTKPAARTSSGSKPS